MRLVECRRLSKGKKINPSNQFVNLIFLLLLSVSWSEEYYEQITNFTPLPSLRLIEIYEEEEMEFANEDPDIPYDINKEFFARQSQSEPFEDMEISER